MDLTGAPFRPNQKYLSKQAMRISGVKKSDGTFSSQCPDATLAGCAIVELNDGKDSAKIKVKERTFKQIANIVAKHWQYL